MPAPLIDPFPTFLRQARIAADLTQGELGDAIGRGRDAISDWESGVKGAFFLRQEQEIVQRLSRALCVPIDDLVLSLLAFRSAAGGYIRVQNGRFIFAVNHKAYQQWANDYAQTLNSSDHGDNGIRTSLATLWGATESATERRISRLRNLGYLPPYKQPHHELCGSGLHEMVGNNVVLSYRADRSCWYRSCRACGNRRSREYQRNNKIPKLPPLRQCLHCHAKYVPRRGNQKFCQASACLKFAQDQRMARFLAKKG